MRRVQAQRREVDTQALWRKVPAKPEDFTTVIDEPSLVYEGDKLRAVYLLPTDNLNPLLRAVKTIRFDAGYRTVGLKTTSRVFGYRPRLTIRKDYCSSASLAKDSPIEHQALCVAGVLASTYFKTHAPEVFAQQEAILKEKVRQDWVIPSSVFTSGICNWNNQLYYHFDAGNFSGSWNCMYVFHKDVKGGDLSLPQLDVGFKFQSGSLVMFDGQSLLHGVTPMKKLSPRYYRYSIVYYAMQQMCHCQSPKEELERIRKVKTEREYKRLNGVHPRGFHEVDE